MGQGFGFLHAVFCVQRAACKKPFRELRAVPLRASRIACRRYRRVF